MAECVCVCVCHLRPDNSVGIGALGEGADACIRFFFNMIWEVSVLVYSVYKGTLYWLRFFFLQNSEKSVVWCIESIKALLYWLLKMHTCIRSVRCVLRRRLRRRVPVSLVLVYAVWVSVSVCECVWALYKFGRVPLPLHTHGRIPLPLHTHTTHTHKHTHTRTTPASPHSQSWHGRQC